MNAEAQDWNAQCPSEVRFAAARGDMEYRTALPAARHYIENLLAAFSHAVCTRDTGHLGELTKGTSISLEGPRASVSDPNDPKQIMAWFGSASSVTTQLISNMSIQRVEDSVVYIAHFQEWETEPHLTCTAVGTYHGRLQAGPQVWRWTDHGVKVFGTVEGQATKSEASLGVGAAAYG